MSGNASLTDAGTAWANAVIELARETQRLAYLTERAREQPDTELATAVLNTFGARHVIDSLSTSYFQGISTDIRMISGGIAQALQQDLQTADTARSQARDADTSAGSSRDVTAGTVAPPPPGHPDIVAPPASAHPAGGGPPLAAQSAAPAQQDARALTADIAGAAPAGTQVSGTGGLPGWLAVAPEQVATDPAAAERVRQAQALWKSGPLLAPTQKQDKRGRSRSGSAARWVPKAPAAGPEPVVTDTRAQRPAGVRAFTPARRAGDLDWREISPDTESEPDVTVTTAADTDRTYADVATAAQQLPALHTVRTEPNVGGGACKGTGKPGAKGGHAGAVEPPQAPPAAGFAGMGTGLPKGTGKHAAAGPPAGPGAGRPITGRRLEDIGHWKGKGPGGKPGGAVLPPGQWWNSVGTRKGQKGPGEAGCQDEQAPMWIDGAQATEMQEAFQRRHIADTEARARRGIPASSLWAEGGTPTYLMDDRIPGYRLVIGDVPSQVNEYNANALIIW